MNHKQVESQKIGLLAPEIFTVGGVQTYMRLLLQVLNNLVEKGYSAFYISVNDSPRKVSQQKNVEGFTAGHSKIMFLLLTLKNARNAKYILVGHIGQAPVAWLLKKLRMISNYAVILHGIEAWERLPIVKRIALRGAKDIIATTHYTAEICAAKNDLSTKNVTIIPLCVDALVVQPSDLKLNGEFKILCVGRQAKTENGKGYHMLIDAMTHLIEEFPGVHLNFVGQGDGQQRLIQISRELGLVNYITFWGCLSDEDLQAAYKSCSVFVMPSKKEGFGIVFLEAMRWGKPCIGGNHGGTPEVIQDGKSGFLIDFDDVSMLVKRLQQFITNPKLREGFGCAGAELVKTKYSFKSFNNEFRRLLCETC